MLTLAFTGDVMLGRLVNDRLKTMQPAEVWGDVLPHLAQADLRIVNLECALTTHLQPWTRTEKIFHFRADPEAVRLLQAAHIDACALANNHFWTTKKKACAIRCAYSTRPASAMPVPVPTQPKQQLRR